jgi:hypothetical protein
MQKTKLNLKEIEKKIQFCEVITSEELNALWEFRTKKQEE